MNKGENLAFLDNRISEYQAKLDAMTSQRAVVNALEQPTDVDLVKSPELYVEYTEDSKQFLVSAKEGVFLSNDQFVIVWKWAKNMTDKVIVMNGLAFKNVGKKKSRKKNG